MSIHRDVKSAWKQAKRGALALALAAVAGLPCAAQVVDLQTESIQPPVRTNPAIGANRQNPVPNQGPEANQRPGDNSQPGQNSQTRPNPQGGNQDPDGLNTNPNATIQELQQNQADDGEIADFDPGVFGLGATSASLAASPYMMGDFFGGGFAFLSGTQTVRFSGFAPGVIVMGSPGDANSIIAFEFGADGTPNDVFTDPPGQDLVTPSDGADTFSIVEPLPTSDALSSPGAGFTFDGGTAVYTNSNSVQTAQSGTFQDGELWFISYSYSSAIGVEGQEDRPVPSPGVTTRRVKIAENFSPEVRNRCFSNYSFFNDAFGGLGDISRYIFGFERILFDDMVSIEGRLPTAGSYGSTQDLDQLASRNFEIGNATLIMKTVLLRTGRLIFSGGLGVALPTAQDTIIRNGGNRIVVIRNETVHLLPFLAAQWRFDRATTTQAYIQLDVATNGDPVFADLTGGPLPFAGKFNDSTLLHLDWALNRRIYQNRRGRIKQIFANAELHYTGTLQSSDVVTANGLTYTNLKSNFNIVNTTLGAHIVLSDRLSISPGMSIPLRSGLDKQFDYEALVQLNYMR